MNVALGYFHRKIEPKEIPSCLIPCLLVVFTPQLEILVTFLWCLGQQHNTTMSAVVAHPGQQQAFSGRSASHGIYHIITKLTLLREWTIATLVFTHKLNQACWPHDSIPKQFAGTRWWQYTWVQFFPQCHHQPPLLNCVLSFSLISDATQRYLSSDHCYFCNINEKPSK